MKSSSSNQVIGSRPKQPSGNQKTWGRLIVTLSCFLLPFCKTNNPVISRQATGYSIPSKDRNSIFPEERVEPCHLSSSIYYGGQDNYSKYPSAQTAGSYPIYMEDGGEGDPNRSSNNNNTQDACRGNWWQGTIP
ncbi:hypothetical protein Tsubulata_032159 [Turnera subulata]|uniref:Uncharacterized protein n=1 Tax=Turnera subulata TaxID=218843 RepID=A0A9Q0G5E8_9ROSI|nr:hypothetical protein Tsubulata_032159 [Turnera subulata]